MITFSDIFKWIGRLFVGQASDMGHQVISDEIDKHHEEITAVMGQAKTVEDQVAVAKKVGVSAVEAYIDSRVPTIVPPKDPSPTPEK